MEKLDLGFFPFPYATKDDLLDGWALPILDLCKRCDGQCISSKTVEIGLCSYGLNYRRIDADMLVCGIIILDHYENSHAKAKNQKRYRTHIVRSADIDRAVISYTSMRSEAIKKAEEHLAINLDRYETREKYKKEYLDNLKPQIERSFSYFHDYRQFITQIKENINVTLISHYGSGEIDTLLSKALPSEAAIYWASQMMEEKLRTAFLLIHPELIVDPERVTVFRLHGLVLKYVRIYQYSFTKKEIATNVIGHSEGEIRGNSPAVSIIPHTFIDNALKYSPRGGRVDIRFAETAKTILLEVSSFGPKIKEDEQEAIFNIFIRGKHAQEQEEEGAGFGLYLAQFVAAKMGTKVTARQETLLTKGKGFWTTFSIEFARER